MKNIVFLDRDIFSRPGVGLAGSHRTFIAFPVSPHGHHAESGMDSARSPGSATFRDNIIFARVSVLSAESSLSPRGVFAESALGGASRRTYFLWDSGLGAGLRADSAKTPCELHDKPGPHGARMRHNFGQPAAVSWMRLNFRPSDACGWGASMCARQHRVPEHGARRAADASSRSSER